MRATVTCISAWCVTAATSRHGSVNCTTTWRQAYAKAYSYGGVASGEHGIGISKRSYFLRETAEDNLAVMNAIKTALDPKHTLNDQKSYIVGGK